MMRLQGLATDAQLLGAVDSDPDAFARFYERHETVVMGYLMRRVRDPEAAADLAAEVFAAALESASRCQAAGATAVPWLLTIAHNTMISSLRRGRVEDAARRRMGMFGIIELREESLRRIDRLVVGDAWHGGGQRRRVHLRGRDRLAAVAEAFNVLGPLGAGLSSRFTTRRRQRDAIVGAFVAAVCELGGPIRDSGACGTMVDHAILPRSSMIRAGVLRTRARFSRKAQAVFGTGCRLQAVQSREAS
jgi:RNA polymerase sigma-70 factor (ECF subfamily)